MRVASFEKLRDRIDESDARIAIVGLGYVGIPVALSLAAAGYDVVGYDVNPARTEALNSGVLPLATTEPGLRDLLAAALGAKRLRATADGSSLDGVDVAILAVDTPIGDEHRPDPSRLIDACASVAARAAKPALVVIESTVAPGSMRAYVAPAFPSPPAQRIR